MKPTSDYKNRCTNFELTEAKEKSAPPINKAVSPPPINNAYQRAYQDAFLKLPVWRQKEVTTLKASKDLDNPHYTDFIKEVARLGDEYYG